MSPETDVLERLDFLLAQICHLHHARAHQLLEGIRLYRGQPPMLFALWDQEGQTQTELAARLKVTPATMTKMLQRMEKTGFIQRQPDPSDQRVSRVYLTESGRAIQSELEGIWQKMDAEVFGSFNPADQARLRQFLRQIRLNLEHATGEKPFH